MRNSTRILAMEFGIAVAMLTWPAIKDKYLPWPAPFIRTAFSFSVFAMLDVIVPGFGALLGAGIMLAVFVKNSAVYTGKAEGIAGYPDFLMRISPLNSTATLSAGSYLRFGQTGPTGIHPTTSSFIIGNGGSGTTGNTTNPSTGGTVTV